MSGLFGSTKTQSAQKPQYSGISIQQSTAGVAIPFGYGQFRAGNNIIWKNDFSSVPHTTKSASGGKGGGSGPSNTTYTYTTAVALAICEGPIQGVLQVWADQTVTTLAALNLTLMLGSNTQDPSTYMLSTHPDQAFNFRGTAYVVSGSYDLGDSANLPTHTFEIQGALCNSVASVSDLALPDANMADIIADFLVNAQFGVGMGSAQIGDLTAYRTYCQAQGLLFSPYYDSQTQASSIMSDWGSWTNTAIFWSGDQIKFVPLGDQTIAANGTTYVPDLTPLFDLTDSDFMHTSGADPVTCDRADPTDSYNHFQLEYLDRSNNYNTAIAEYKDDGFILLYGLRTASVISAHDICDSSIANVVIQLIGRRTLYVRNTYNFKLSWEYCLLEPADIVTLTDVNLGIDKFPVRIVSIEEDKDGYLSVVAEEFPASIGTATAYPHEGANPYLIDYNAAPGGINDPVIFEPTSALVASPEVWIAASGGTNWGGADIWISPDNLTYERRGTISGPARQGLLTSALGAHADPDTTNVLAVGLAESRGTLSGGTQADADAFRTLIYVDGELMSYETASLTGANAYNLTYLRRGLYGTPISAHSAGAQFACLDNAIFEYPLPDAYIGIPLYFKFLSYNQFKGGQQGLEDVTPFMYTPNGNGSFINPPTELLLSSAVRLAADGTALSTLVASWTASPGPSLAGYQLQYRIHTTGGTNPWLSVSLDADVTSWTLTPATENALYDVQIRAVSGLSPPSYSTYDSVTAGSAVVMDGTVLAAPISLTATAGQRQIELNWAYPGGGFNASLVAGTEIWYVEGSSVTLDPVTADATLLTTAAGTSYLNANLDLAEGRTYWLRFISWSRTEGTFSGGVFAVTPATFPIADIGREIIDESMLVPELSAAIASIDPGLEAVFAGIKVASQTFTSQNTAIATSLETVQTTVNGQTSLVSEALTSIDGVKAEYTVQAEVDVNGVPYIAGFGVIADLIDGVPSSEATFLVSKFIIAQLNDDGSVNPIAPFAVVDGQVIVQDALIGSLAANKITTGTLVGSLITVAPTTTSEGLLVLDVAGNTIIDSEHGIFPGAATKIYKTTTGDTGSIVPVSLTYSPQDFMTLTSPVRTGHFSKCTASITFDSLFTTGFYTTDEGDVTFTYMGFLQVSLSMDGTVVCTKVCSGGGNVDIVFPIPDALEHTWTFSLITGSSGAITTPTINWTGGFILVEDYK